MNKQPGDRQLGYIDFGNYCLLARQPSACGGAGDGGDGGRRVRLRKTHTLRTTKKMKKKKRGKSEDDGTGK